jgi:small-conductance mechanosensitive channel
MDNILELESWFHQDLLRQVLVLGLFVVLSQVVYWGTIQSIKKRIIDIDRPDQSGHGWLKAGLFLFRSFFILSALLISMGVFYLLNWPIHFLKTILQVISFWVLVRLFFLVVRRAFRAAAWTRYLEKVLVILFIFGSALHFIGYLDSVLLWLGSFHFKIGKYGFTIFEVIESALWLFGCLILGVWIGGAIENKLMEGVENSEYYATAGVRVVLARISKALIFIVCILIGMGAAGIDLTILSVVGGALGVGLGFGLQRIASNYISGFVLLLEKSLSLGMLVTVDKFSGRVTKINTRFTVIDCFDGREALIPNELLVNNPVENLGFSNHNVRIDVAIQVAYGTDLRFVLKLLLDIAKRQPRVLLTPEPFAQVREFSADGINLKVAAWVGDPENGRDNVRSDILLAIWDAFKEHNIVIPYPQRELRVITGTPNDLLDVFQKD